MAALLSPVSQPPETAWLTLLTPVGPRDALRDIPGSLLVSAVGPTAPELAPTPSDSRATPLSWSKNLHN